MYMSLYQDSILGTVDDFISEHPGIDWTQDDPSALIEAWNINYIQPLVSLYYEQNGLELSAENRIFVIAVNPKQSSYPVRTTHYFERCGALCEFEAMNIEEAIIECLISYPDAVPAPGILDQWMMDPTFSAAFR